MAREQPYPEFQDPDRQERYDRLFEEYKAAREDGMLGYAIRVLTRMRQLENEEFPEHFDEEEEDQTSV